MNTKSLLTMMWCFLASGLIFGQAPAAPQRTGPEKQTVATVCFSGPVRGGVGGSFRGQPPRARTPRLSVLFPKKDTLIDNFEGKPFGVLADIVADKKGGVYITEPAANSVYYYSPAGKFTRVASDNEAANGVMLSRDEKTLYVTNGPKGILAYEVQPDGSIKNARLFANPEGGVDGLAIDSEGRVYDCSRLGIQVMSPDGKSLGLIPMPRGATTLAFAGPDKKTLYIIGRGHDGPGGDGALARSMYKVPMLAQGFKGRAK